MEDPVHRRNPTAKPHIYLDGGVWTARIGASIMIRTAFFHNLPFYFARLR